MFKPEVITKTGSNYCVVRLNSAHHIEAWFYGTGRNYTAIYVVKDKECYLSFNVPNHMAPETIIDLIKDYLRTGKCGRDTSNKLAA